MLHAVGSAVVRLERQSVGRLGLGRLGLGGQQQRPPAPLIAAVTSCNTRRMLSVRASRSELPLLRLPTVLFPSQPLSLRLTSDAGDPLPFEGPDMTAPAELVGRAWREFDGKVVAVGPCGHIGVELHLMADHGACSQSGRPPLSCDSGGVSTPAGVAHAVGGRRLRLLRSSCAQPGERWRQATVEALHDDLVTERRRERLSDEAARAATLIAAGAERRAFALELCTLDEELGELVCDPRAHPSWPAQATPPVEPADLSLWLAARLPLTTALRMRLLACVCPLKRITDVVDAMRLLLEPHSSSRFEHRLRLHVLTPSGDNCSAVGVPSQPPRSFVGEAPPSYAWNENSFPHG